MTFWEFISIFSMGFSCWEFMKYLQLKNGIKKPTDNINFKYWTLAFGMVGLVSLVIREFLPSEYDQYLVRTIVWTVIFAFFFWRNRSLSAEKNLANP